MTKEFLAGRIREIQTLAASADIRHLTADEVEALHEEVLLVLKQGQRLEASDFSRAGLDAPVKVLVAWLEGVEQCIAYWPFNREAIELPCRLFEANFNDLWNPGEVVWLCSPQPRAEWRIMISDDEVAERWRFVAAG